MVLTVLSPTVLLTLTWLIKEPLTAFSAITGLEMSLSSPNAALC